MAPSSIPETLSQRLSARRRAAPFIPVPPNSRRWIPDCLDQTVRQLEKPIALPKGTQLHALAHFDNSPENPFNPNPNIDVRYGEPTTAEMMFSFYMYTVDSEKLRVKDPGA